MAGQVHVTLVGFVLILPVTTQVSDISSFIVDGENARDGDYPWQLSFQRRSKRGTWVHTCGATLIRENFAITASHCIYNFRERGPDGTSPRFRLEEMRVVAGTHSTTQLDPDADIYALKRAVAPTGLSVLFDLALLELNVSANTSRADISPIAMGNSSDIAVGTLCTLTGWGLLTGNRRRTPATLQEGRMVIVSMRKCEESGWRLLFTSHLCATGRPRGVSGCYGDSGSPLTCVRTDGTPVVVGIFSRGSATDCSATRPNVFSRLTFYRHWLRRVTQIPDL